VNGRQYLPPRLLQLVGLLLLMAFGVFWAVTGRESVLLVGAAMSLILLGAYGSAQQALKDLTAAPTPPPAVPPPNGQPPPEQAEPGRAGG
jgi:hypothetical protein